MKLKKFTIEDLYYIYKEYKSQQIDALLEFITSLLQHPNPGKQLNQLGLMIKDVFQLIPSDKHMSGRDLGRLCLTPTLK